MKTTALALAALLALSSGAMAAQAKQPAATNADLATTCAQSATKLDCSSTGSLEKSKPAPAPSEGPRLGIGVNPWIMPSTF
ncbi:hypothetical protein ASD50_00095 [Mesorhizobium sp. Root552]|nr:hypothetical protein ASD50_00095 [Mesorhizobium sp. Root552]